MKVYKLAKKEKQEDDLEKMKEWFEKRTRMHIGLVQKYIKKIADYDDRFEELIERNKLHDQSKFEDPENEPYLYISWQYKCKDDGVDWEPPENIKEKMSKATEHHVKNNPHHPEFYSEEEVALINREDRDKPPEKMVDGTKMKDVDIADMCGDWFGMSEERGTNPKEWADNNVNIRWKFTDSQKDLIYELIDKVWENNA